MMIRTLFVFLVSAAPAMAQSPNYKYYEATGATPCATIKALDVAYCTRLGCDGVQTTYWFPIIVLQNGACAAQVKTGDAYYDVTVTLPSSAKFPQGVTATLTPQQQAALVTRVSLVGLLPDFMTLAQFEAVLTTPQLNQLNAAGLKTSHPVIYNAWQAVQANGGYDMEDPNAQTLASEALSLGFITQAQYITLTTPITTAPGP